MNPAARPFAVLVVALAVTACSGIAATPGPGTSPAAAVVDTPEAAVAAVQARTPWFDGVRRKDPTAIGQAQWWEVTPAVAASPVAGSGLAPTAWRVSITVGWGDCQAGCIDRHTWTWTVTRDGTVTFDTETGSALPADQAASLAAAASTVTGVGGRVTASPTCPVERVGDPNCVPRPVAGAVLVVRGPGGAEVARVTTDGSGLYRVSLPPGDYTLEPQAVQGIMVTGPPAPFTVVAGKETAVPVDYDTGIR